MVVWVVFKEECQELIYRICCATATSPTTAKELLHREQPKPQQIDSEEGGNAKILHLHYIPTHLPELDSILRGGIRLNSITEIVGSAGIGKTQLVMQLAIVASAYNMGCIYIDTERKLSLLRLNEIATERYNSNRSRNGGGGDITTYSNDYTSFGYDDYNERQENSYEEDQEGRDCHSDNNSSNPEYKPPKEVLDNITVHSPKSTKDLVFVISKLQEYILEKTHCGGNDVNAKIHPIKLIILDSIAAPTRRDFGGEDARERVTCIFKIAQMLKQVACEMNVAVVVINQIDKVVISSTTNTNNNVLSSVKASLGTSWHHCVSSRILLEHDDDTDCQHAQFDSIGSIGFKRVRKATVVKSNLVSCASTNFEITGMGICQL